MSRSSSYSPPFQAQKIADCAALNEIARSMNDGDRARLLAYAEAMAAAKGQIGQRRTKYRLVSSAKKV